MKVCLVAHGYPPELVGGTETMIQGLARTLARGGHEVVVVAGTMAHEQGFRTSEAVDRHPSGEGSKIRVHRIHRADLYFDHWQKSLSSRAAAAFRELLREEQPDVVHVHHWIRLTRDLVHCAALEGVPATVTLHDLWSTCLITFRVKPGEHEFCEATLGPVPCIDCAQGVPPRTPWMPLENLFMAFAERRGDLVRELTLARAVIAPSRAHARAIERFLGLDADALDVRVIPHGRDLALAPATPPPGPGPDGKLVLGAWGHLTPLKGQDLLLRALRLLPDPARVALHLAGGQPLADYAADLRRLAAGLDVTFHGDFTADQLAGHPVTEVHAMVSGTRAHESWGLVIDEAAALRLPMILPASGALAERLVEGAGATFYAANDEASLAKRLQELLDAPATLTRLRDGLPPLEDVAPSLAVHTAHILAVYAEVVAAGPVEPPAEDWWRARMQQVAEDDWDRNLSQRTAEELGLA